MSSLTITERKKAHEVIIFDLEGTITIGDGVRVLDSKLMSSLDSGNKNFIFNLANN
jgi:hypothetical protein